MKRLKMLAILILLPILSFGLTFEDIVQSAGILLGEETAVLAFREAEAKASSAAYPGDVSLSFQPGVLAVTPNEGTFAEELIIDGSASISVPLGLNVERQQALENAIAEAALTEGQLEITRAGAIFDLWTMYQTAWIAHQESAVLETEVAAAEKAMLVSEELFRSGAISLAELQRSEELLRDRQVEFLEGDLARRISWLELAYAADLDPSVQHTLEAFTGPQIVLPRPPDLTTWALEHDPQILSQREKIRQIEKEIGEISNLDFSSTIRANLSLADHAASVSYNSSGKTLAGTYAFPIITLGDAEVTSGGGSGAAESWSLGFSVNLAFSGGFAGNRESSFDQNLLLISLEQEVLKLAGLEEAIGLQIRSQYQRYVLGREAVDQAARNLEMVTAKTTLVRSLFSDSRVTASELLEADAQLLRAEYQLTAAQLNVREAAYSAAESASYIHQLIGIGEE